MCLRKIIAQKIFLKKLSSFARKLWADGFIISAPGLLNGMT
jgi:hypothetical protein